MDLQTSIVDRLKVERDISGLVKLLMDKDWSVRRDAALALGEIGDIVCVVPLTQRLHDTHLDVRIAACDSFLKMGDQVVDLLIQALRDDNRVVREGVVQVLGKLGDSRAIYPLIGALRDTARKRISDAVRSFGVIAFEPLVQALKNEDSRIRMGAAMILGEMKNPEAVKPLGLILEDEDPLVRQYARTAIYMIKRESRKKKQASAKSK